MFLRDLITSSVREEISAYRARQKQKRGFRWLSLPELRASLDEGKATYGKGPGPPPVDEARAIQAAFDAVSDGIVLVFAGSENIRHLDTVVPSGLQDSIRFIKLTAQRGL